MIKCKLKPSQLIIFDTCFVVLFYYLWSYYVKTLLDFLFWVFGCGEQGMSWEMTNTTWKMMAKGFDDTVTSDASWVEDQYDLKVLPSHYEESAYKEKNTSKLRMSLLDLVGIPLIQGHRLLLCKICFKQSWFELWFEWRGEFMFTLAFLVLHLVHSYS